MIIQKIPMELSMGHALEHDSKLRIPTARLKVFPLVPLSILVLLSLSLSSIVQLSREIHGDLQCRYKSHGSIYGQIQRTSIAT